MAISINEQLTGHEPLVRLSSSSSQSGVVAQPWDSPTEVIHLKENEFVFREGDVPKGLYLLKTGAVKMMVTRSFTRGRMASPEFVNKVVSPGEFFGYKALIKGTNYNYMAKTLRACELHIYSRDVIASVMNGPNTLLKMVLQQVVRDFENNDITGQLHYLASVQERIAYQLVLLGDRFGLQTSEGVSLNLRLTRNELAQLAGTINESLSRHLTEFKEDGLIELNGKEIIIKDRAGLAARSGNFR